MTINELVLFALTVSVLTAIVVAKRCGATCLITLYRYVAVTCFSAGVLFLFALTIVEQWYGWEQATRQRAAHLHGEKEMAQAGLLGLSSAEFQLLREETRAAPLPYEYDAWLHVKDRPRQGSYVTVLEKGYRHTIGSDDASPYTVYLFGGSTQFGWLVPDKDTIASQLQSIINNRFGSGAVSVRNFGRSTYYSAQEALLLATLLHEGHRPSVVVFLDGMNENRNTPALSEEFRDFFKKKNSGSRAERTTQIFEVLSSFALFRALSFESHPVALQYPEEHIGPQEAVDNYHFVQSVVRGLASEYEFDAKFFIQPVPGLKNEFNTHAFVDDYLGAYLDDDSAFQNVVSTLSASQGEFWNMTDLTGLLEGYEGQPFIDADHYTPAVHQLIAKEIYVSLEQVLAERIEAATENHQNAHAFLSQ